jgi:putative transposase
MGKLDFRTRKYIVKELRKGVSVIKLARHYGVSRVWVYKLKNQALDNGIDSLMEKSVGRPKENHSQKIRDLIVKLKREHDWGVHKLTFILKRDHKIKLSHNAVHRILTERGEISKDPKKGYRHNYIRYERQHSNSMWQTDWKWLSEEECWLTAYLDDHSRFIIGASKFTEATTDNTLELFHKSAKKYEYPKQVLTDHGSQYWSKYGSRYSADLEDHGVEHILGRVKKPTTTGKIERWWLTYMHESNPFPTLTAFVHHYNHKRDHQSLNYQTPATIYKKDKV